MLRQDCSRHSIGPCIELSISKSIFFRLDRDSVRISANHLLETLHNRLLDLFSLKLNERSRWMEALRPNGFLLRGQVRRKPRMIAHVRTTNDIIHAHGSASDRLRHRATLPVHPAYRPVLRTLP